MEWNFSCCSEAIMMPISSAMDFSLLLTAKVFVRSSNLLIIPLLTLPTAFPESHVQVHCLTQADIRGFTDSPSLPLSPSLCHIFLFNLFISLSSIPSGYFLLRSSVCILSSLKRRMFWWNLWIRVESHFNACVNFTCNCMWKFLC